MIFNENIIRLEKVDIIYLVLPNKLDMTFSNIVFAPKYNSNLISFSQLKKAEILYYIYLKSITLKKIRNIIGFI